MSLENGIQIRLIKTNKFKDIGCSIRFLNPLSQRDATARSLLALMLCDRCEKYDSKQKMVNIADELYGATLNAQTMGYGLGQVLEIRSKVINPRYVSDEHFLQKWLGFLHEVIFAPKMMNHLLDKELLREAKEILQFKMDRLKDEPSQWAIMRCLQIAGEGTALGISALGDPERLQSITVEEVSEAYQTLIHNNPIEIIVCGDYEEQTMREAIEQAFPFVKRIASDEIHYAIDIKQGQEDIQEYRDISQTTIMMLYATHTNIADDDYWHLKVANAILGQYSSSLLFQEVREKHSLCYSIHSSLISFDGAMGITTGIENSNIEKTKTLIKKQVDRVMEGDFSEDLLLTSKELLSNSLRAIQDDMGSSFSLAYQNALLHQQATVQDFISKVKATTKEDVINVMKKCTHALTYVLTKEESHEENNQ